MAYLYDFFISLKRSKINEQQLKEIFLPFLTSYPTNYRPHPSGIFPGTSARIPGVALNKEPFQFADFLTGYSSLLQQSAPGFKRPIAQKEQSAILNICLIPKKL